MVAAIYSTDILRNDAQNVTELTQLTKGLRLSRFSREIDLWLPPIIMSIGLVGNLLTVFIMSNRRFVKFSTCVYLLAIAIADLLILFVFALNWVEVNFDVFHRLGSEDVMCKVGGFLLMTLVYLSTWSTVAMTIDRFLAVYRPITRRVHKPKIRTVFFFLTLTACLISVPYIGYRVYNVNDHEHDIRCTLSNKSLLGRVFAWVDFFTGTTIPALILISLNSAIIHRIRRNRENSSVDTVSSSVNSMRRTTSATKTPRSLNVLLILASFSFLLTSLPYRIYRIHWFIHEELSTEGGLAPASDNPGLDTVVYRGVKYLWYLSHSLNFYLYVLGGGGRFRYQLWHTLRCKSLRFNSSFDTP